MSYTREREAFIARFCAEAGGEASRRLDAARALLRYAKRLHRLNEAECNGDWPADNGQRETASCARCEGLWAPAVLKQAPATVATEPCTACNGTGRKPRPSEPTRTVPCLRCHGKGKARPRWCPSCRTEAAARAVAEAFGFALEVQGDPRGWPLRLWPAGTTREQMQHSVSGWGIPV